MPKFGLRCTPSQGRRLLRPTPRHKRLACLVSGLLALCGLGLPAPNRAASSLRFVEVSEEAGVHLEHGLVGLVTNDVRWVAGGVAVGDFNGDGWLDLYLIRGPAFPSALLKNLGNGRFLDVAPAAGVDLQGRFSGPSFFDFDGDGLLDLFVGALEGHDPVFLRNLGDETFEDISEQAGIEPRFNSLGHAVGDYDGDGDLDIFVAQWGTRQIQGIPAVHLWANQNDGTFEPLEDEALGLTLVDEFDFTFSPNFADIDGDHLLDLLVVGDFGTSKVFRNQGDGTFADITTADITDENGMGTAIVDYDHDGDLDWFVTSIFDPNQVAEGLWGVTGNRMYRNPGDGRFKDVTDEAGVRMGYWGWAACAADFDNDAHPDLFHINGWPEPVDEFLQDPSRMFLNNGDGTFTEASEEVGLVDADQGRGVACFDYDRDGDIDIFVANNSGFSSLYRNDLEPGSHFLNLVLEADSPNTQGVGTKVEVRAGGLTQTQWLSLGNNYVSHMPAELHFGLGDTRVIDELSITWPDGNVDRFHGVVADRFLLGRPGSLTDTQPGCAPFVSTLCLNNDRFEVEVRYQTLEGVSGSATTVSITEDTGYFWFFTPRNVEVLVKVLNGCPLNEHFWVFAAGLTNVGVELTIRDTVTGTVRGYENSLGSAFAPIQDVTAFVCP